MMTTTTGQNYDKNITGFKPFFVITFLVGMVLVGMTPVLVPSYILSVTGSATDLALMLSLMTLGTFAVPLLAGAADKYRSHRLMQSLSLLAASAYAILGFTQRPLGFAVVGLLVAFGLTASLLFITTYLLNGGYSDKAQPMLWPGPAECTSSVRYQARYSLPPC